MYYVEHDADAYQALLGNLLGPLEKLAAFGEAHGHAPELEKAPMTDEGCLFWVSWVYLNLVKAYCEVNGRPRL